MTAVPHGPINEPIWSVPRDEQPALLRAPLAGIELGAYDERILDWIAEICDTPTVTTIASLLHRARAAQPLPGASDEPRFDLTTSGSTSSEAGVGGGHLINRDLTAAELDAKLAEHGITRHEGNKGDVTLTDGQQLLWQPADADTVTISRTEFDRLTQADEDLGALHAAGVDNWEGDGEAVQP